MTDNEIIKALEYCIVQIGKCGTCPYDDDDYEQCFDKLKKDALNLINLQNAEIESLTKRYEMAVAEREANVKGFAAELESLVERKGVLEKALQHFVGFELEGKDPIASIKAQGAKEIAEKIQKHCTSIELNEYINTLVEEMEEEYNNAG